MYFAGEDFSILSPFSQIDGITYNAVDTNGPESNAEVFDIDAISESFRSDVHPVLVHNQKLDLLKY